MKSLSLRRISLVLLSACLVLFTQITHSSVAQTLTLVVIDLNMITVTCLNAPSGPYTFIFTFPNGSSESRPPVTQDTTIYTFTVTPNNETNVRCGGDSASRYTSITFAGEKNLDRLVFTTVVADLLFGVCFYSIPNA